MIRRPMGSLRVASNLLLVVVPCILLLMPAPVWLGAAAMDPAAELSDVDPVKNAALICVYLAAALTIACRWKKFAPSLRASLGVWAIVGLALVSALWSRSPETTARRSIALLLTTLYGVFLAEEWDTIRLLRLLVLSFVTVAALSAFFALCVPAIGIDPVAAGGGWRGIFTTKNSLGRSMAIGLTIAAALAGADPSGRRRTAAAACAMSCVLLLSLSATAVLATVASLACTYAVYQLRAPKRRAVLLAALCFLVPAATVACFVGASSIFDLLGRDATLTGRLPLWGEVIDRVRMRPILGYGYSGFWLEGDQEHVPWIWRAIGWQAPNSHNGLLDLALDLGLVGVFSFAVLYVTAVKRAYRAAVSSTDPAGPWALAFLAFLIFVNITESSLLMRNHILWVLFVAVWVQVTRRHLPRLRAATLPGRSGLRVWGPDVESAAI